MNAWKRCSNGVIDETEYGFYILRGLWKIYITDKRETRKGGILV